MGRRGANRHPLEASLNNGKKIGYIDFPQAILRRRKWVYFDSIIDLWKLEDAWWTEEPQRSIYFKLSVSERELTVCHDLALRNWSQYRGIY